MTYTIWIAAYGRFDSMSLKKSDNSKSRITLGYFKNPNCMVRTQGSFKFPPSPPIPTIVNCQYFDQPVSAFPKFCLSTKYSYTTPNELWIPNTMKLTVNVPQHTTHPQPPSGFSCSSVSAASSVVASPLKIFSLSAMTVH